VEYPEHLDLVDELIVDSNFAATTSNRMELVACIEALEWIRRNRPWAGVTRVQIITDSKYVRDDISRSREWLSNDGRNLHGEAKKNLDLWKRLHGERSIVGMRVDFEWRLGKTSPIQKAVDKAAKDAANRAGLYGDAGFKAGKISPSKVAGAAEIFAAQGQTLPIYIYRKNPRRRGVNEIRFHLVIESEQRYDGSFYAYASDALETELHRQHSYRVRFNDSPRNPEIIEILSELPR
jgi:ribonuclease HI